ncbi:type III PLP-dependent enzyme domain-containing protein [Nocardiopsis lambiniae]|uniref:Alanine racemase n=1 Tax=Nocardiopsis lambiniae TaxID=3075539 RepID=A0ABU2M4H1_9ACTN|nr:alanine racemase [Nocardiopsis sp. DSM 44743]MDT0327529.1 alanine racemase [Nocardiopsis sp. DSM 44743]
MNDRPDVPGELVDRRTKGVWWPGGPIPAADFAARRDRLFDGPFTWPLLVLRESALERNVAALAEFTRAHGLLFAPHGKTSMAPALLRRQLEAGAWGITVATANQALAVRGFGVRRILLANQLLDPRVIRWAAEEMSADRGFDLLFYVDSPEGVAAVAAAAQGWKGERFPGALIERGVPGGRTGARTRGEVLDLAHAVDAIPGAATVGVAGYEGPLSDADGVRGFLRDLRGDVEALLAQRGPGPGRPILTVGGSAWFDLVAEEIGGMVEALPILRSGAYITHDDGLYRRVTPYNRLPEGGDALTGALELWAQVTSAPEEGLAIAGMGRRDAGYDQDLPIPRVLRRADGTAVPADGVRVTKFDDQHAYLSVPVGLDVRPGDLMSFGISHPCTTFDKWRSIPVVDDADTVVDLIATYF